MPTFQAKQKYEVQGYELLPFRFLHLDEQRYILTNAGGEFAIIPKAKLADVVHRQLDRQDPIYKTLESRLFIRAPDNEVALELLANQYRTRQSILPSFTGLHMFVVSLRCDHSCKYCQVSRVSEDRMQFDMNERTADLAVDMMLRSPSPALKVEFQGGEPLLNFGIVRHIVETTHQKKGGRHVDYVIATNLSHLTDEILQYCKLRGINISTSLDGPEWLHNQNRPRPTSNSHQLEVDGIARCRAVLGPSSVSALMTTTPVSLEHPDEIVDEYVRLGFRSIFLRWISPYGFAARLQGRLAYSTEEYLRFYRRGLDHVIKLNQAGYFMREEYAALVLKRVLTTDPTGYVDLMSPAGLGLAALVYNYDGKVYASDESRMLAEMGDARFCLGELGKASYEDLFLKSGLLQLTLDTMAEGIPICDQCALQPYCGTDPVFHYRSQGDPVGTRVSSDYCIRNMEIMRHVIRLLEDDPKAAEVLRTWL